MRVCKYNKVWMMVILVLAACSRGDEVVPEAEPVAMSFSTSVDGVASTRAVTGLENTYTSFCVRAVKKMADDSQQTVMSDYCVLYDETQHWYYDGVNGQTLKFWDAASSSYMFAAVAPDPSTITTTSNISIGDDGEITLSLKDLDTDWLIARTVRTMATPEDKDDLSPNSQFPTPNSQFDVVPLNFHRILSKVIFKAYADDALDIDPLEVGFTNINTCPATYSTVDVWTTTQKTAQEVYDKTTQITAAHCDREHALLLTSLYVIPQQLDGTPGVKIKVKLDNDDDQTATLNIPGSWKANTIYTYYLKFDVFNPTEVILFEVVVEPWKRMDEQNEQEVTQTNW